MRPESRILFMMSGSIACAKATGLISAWKKAGHEVQVAATRSVAEFVGRATLEGLSGRPLFDDTFAAGRAMEHITLAQWADVVVACPASANLLAKFAQGIADDAVSTLWQATWGRNVPQFIVPAMNTHMWNYPATRENVERLKRWGIHVLPTASGELACGETGAGRMLEVEVIRQRVERTLAFDRPAGGLRILVTGGGTREPIDAVRYIGNHSTGATAATLAETFRDRGHDVTWLGGDGAVVPAGALRRERYSTFADLSGQLERLLGDGGFDAVVHAAAVSDFSVDPTSLAGGRHHGKLSSREAMSLQLKPNPKLLDRLRSWSDNRRLQVVGFKLTVDAGPEARHRAVARLFEGGVCDLVVHNDCATMSAECHPFSVLAADGSARDVEGAEALALELLDLLEPLERNALRAGRAPGTAAADATRESSA